MPATAPRDATIAVIGEGFGSLIVHSTAVYLGFRPEDISVYGPNDNPVVLGSPQRLQRDTDWAPAIGIDETLSDLLGYWRRHLTHDSQ